MARHGDPRRFTWLVGLSLLAGITLARGLVEGAEAERTTGPRGGAGELVIDSETWLAQVPESGESLNEGNPHVDRRSKDERTFLQAFDRAEIALKSGASRSRIQGEIAVLTHLAQKVGTRDAADRLLISRARLAYGSGVEFLSVLDDLDSAIARRTDESSMLKFDLLTWQGNLAYQFGLSHRARQAREETARLGLELDLRDKLAWLAFNYAITYPEVVPPSAEQRNRHRAELEQVLALAEAIGDKRRQIRARALLGQLTTGDEALAHFDRCQELLNDPEAGGDAQCRSECFGGRALALLLEGDSEAANIDARSALHFAITALESPDSKDGVWPLVYGWSFWFEHWAATLEQDEFRRLTEHLLGVLDSVARRQVAEEGAAYAQAGWAEPFYWLSGRALGPQYGPPDPFYALWLVEWLRGRQVFEGATRSPFAIGEGGLESKNERDARILAERNLHLRLLDPELSTAATLAAEKDLETLTGIDPTSYPPRDLLAQIQAALSDNEAMLSFQIADPIDRYGRFFGGSWLIVATRNEVRIYSIDNLELPRLAEFLSLRDKEAEGGDFLSRWYELLFEEALTELPATIKHLVLVPDGDLFLVPFAAVGPTRAERLGSEFELSVVPSARLWLHWQESPVTTPGGWALGLADPILAPKPRQGPSRSRLPATRRSSFERLPKSQEEVDSIRESLGGGRTVRLIENEASEARLKAMDLEAFSTLHFGTHGLVDLEQPDNSAIGLAPGSDVEDGWLYPHEIEALDLTDKLVVLAACETAIGPTIRTEGAMSLARPVLKAGGRVVVASLWPVRDDYAAALFGKFYERLGEGETVGAAMTSAQADLRENDSSIDSWAAFQVIGDASFRPFPLGSPQP